MKKNFTNKLPHEKNAEMTAEIGGGDGNGGDTGTPTGGLASAVV